MINDKEVKIYMSKIKALFPVYSSAERQFVTQLDNNIKDYLSSHQESSLEDVVNQFGEPIEIVQSYVESMDVEMLIDKISTRKILRRIAVFILTAAIIGLSIFGGYYFKGYQYYKNTVITKNETVIDD